MITTKEKITIDKGIKQYHATSQKGKNVVVIGDRSQFATTYELFGIEKENIQKRVFIRDTCVAQSYKDYKTENILNLLKKTLENNDSTLLIKLAGILQRIKFEYNEGN